jgi:uracil-DNA glycosylase
MNGDLRLAHSLVDWWQLAGVEWDFSETPTDWLADDPPVARRDAPQQVSATQGVDQPRSVPSPAPAPPTAPPVADVALPTDLAAFQQAWQIGALGPDGGDGPYISPAGAARPKVMIITGAPERDDARTVLSGKAGALIENIVRAAGFEVDRFYRASLFPRVVLDGLAAAEHIDHWRRVTLHHIALVVPEMLVIAGGDTARALLGHDPSQKPPVLHFLNHGDQTIKTVVMRKPGLMLHRIAPEKAMAWQSWQLLLTG